jgi:hypothetical protein
MVAALFIVLAPMPGHADDDKDRRGDNDKEIRAEIAALKAQVADLQSQINKLQTGDTTTAERNQQPTSQKYDAGDAVGHDQIQSRTPAWTICQCRFCHGQRGTGTEYHFQRCEYPYREWLRRDRRPMVIPPGLAI